MADKIVSTDMHGSQTISPGHFELLIYRSKYLLPEHLEK